MVHVASLNKALCDRRFIFVIVDAQESIFRLEQTTTNINMKSMEIGRKMFYKVLFLPNEPPRGKTNNVVSEQVRHKPACTSTEKS